MEHEGKSKVVSPPSFVYPVPCLSNSRLRLVPFDRATHVDTLFEAVKDTPSLFTYIAQGPFAVADDFLLRYENVFEGSSTNMLFAILVRSESGDTPNGEVLAGTVGFQNADALNATVEIGYIVIFPEFHGSFVASNAVGLLLLYVLDQSPQGLGLRRCQWQSHAANTVSRRFAEKMLFTFEGVQRFQRIVPKHKPGNGCVTPATDPRLGTDLGPSRDTAVYAHYCDEWVGKREQVLAIMERKS